MLFKVGSIGIISQVMPEAVIVHSHLAMTHGMPIIPDIIGIMPVEQHGAFPRPASNRKPRRAGLEPGRSWDGRETGITLPI